MGLWSEENFLKTLILPLKYIFIARVIHFWHTRSFKIEGMYPVLSHVISMSLDLFSLIITFKRHSEGGTDFI